MYETTSSSLGDDAMLIHDIRLKGAAMTYAQVIEGWRHDEPFRAAFIRLLTKPPYTSYRWETPPITEATADRPFQCVIRDCPQINRDVDERAFAGHFAGAGAEDVVITFPNIGRDAMLIAPCPRASTSMYGHLASFTRAAPLDQNHALWQAVGEAAANRLGDEPVWISTAGLGVIWLHVRLDDQPKYYEHEPYRAAP